jgi:uncharacterized membrane protein
MNFIRNFLSSLAILSILDFVWLGIVAKKFNTQQLQGIARLRGGKLDPLIVPLALVYLLMALGMVLFVVPKIKAGALFHSFSYGAAFGFVVYGIYELTNLTVIKNYPFPFALVDVAWGTVLYGLTAVALSALGCD